VTWTYAAAPADIIRRRTAPDLTGGYRLRLPPPADPEHCRLLVVGDTGDAEYHGPAEAPVDAVARCLAEETALPGSRGTAEALLHTGDVVYKTGEARLYARNLLRPFAPFLAPGEPTRPLTFRVPFLPVPGNHDYHELALWGRLLMAAPGLGWAARAAGRALGYAAPRGGSDAGGPWFEAFVAPEDGDYRPGLRTAVPNRYYQFSLGPADFFALDTNTLDFAPEAPPPVRDAAQLAWLEAALAQSERERPEAWRVVYGHHPLHTTQRNYCETRRIEAVRAHLVRLLRGRVHLFLSGHAHLFEWLTSEALPGTALVVTGGGGQPELGRSVIGPAGLGEATGRRRLAAAGVRAAAVAGRGPAAADGGRGPLHHYLRLEVTPQELRLEPVGVRRLPDGCYRREAPLPAYYTPDPGQPAEVRLLGALVIRHGAAPSPVWG